MGFLKGLAKLATKAITLPVAVVADTVTLGGALTDRRSSYTGDALEDAVENLEEIAEGAADGDIL